MKSIAIVAAASVIASRVTNNRYGIFGGVEAFSNSPYLSRNVLCNEISSYEMFRQRFRNSKSSNHQHQMITASSLESAYASTLESAYKAKSSKPYDDFAYNIEIQTTTSPSKVKSPSKTSMRSVKMTRIKLKGDKKKSLKTAPQLHSNNTIKSQSKPILRRKSNGSTTCKKNLLSREEESKLTYDIRALRRVVHIRDELSLTGRKIDKPYEPTEEEWAVACGLTITGLQRTMLEGQQARSELVAKNAGLVVQIAKRYFRRNTILTLQDMIQEGNMGLMEAAERFDPAKGFKFATYAAWWVRQRILSSIADNSRVIRLPVHVHTMLGKIDRVKKELTQTIGRVPSLPELAHEMEIPLAKLKLYTESSRNVLSLEGAAYSSGGKSLDDKRTIGDGIASDSPTPQDNAEVNFFRQDIRAVINGLESSERDVLVLRYGLDDGNPRTVLEVASRLNISRERVRLVESRAMNKLRHPGRNHNLKQYVEKTEEPKPEMVTPEQIWSF